MQVNSIDSLMVCPFDSNHKVKASKMHNHILRCRRAHPELDRILETCSFNALHRYHPDDREQHLEECLERRKIMQNQQMTDHITSGNLTTPSYTRKTEFVVNNDEEDWEEEIVPSYSKISHKEQSSKSSNAGLSKKIEHYLYQDADEDDDYSKKILKNNNKPEHNERLKRSHLNDQSNDSKWNSNSEGNEISQIKTSNSSVSIANSDDSGANIGNAAKKLCIGRGLLLSKRAKTDN